ncbi:MAG: Fic family protein [Candidatus Micrarchaeota archaeon]|nr:Fic family protein [Candidatus Micrarchaeota archaeon]MDE1848335.1 Fic family protein [Candidatus Micrarchaeota archaeon]MDE1864955.1 Fic family protein [Candidatus Micrarchaeota archaeon]
MSLVIKRIKGKKYYYSFLSYFLKDKPKSFSRYIGPQKPSVGESLKIENSFKDELIQKISGKAYTSLLVSKDDVIRCLLFRDLFQRKYQKLPPLKRRKYDIDSTVRFTLTTLTTEEVEVDLTDVENALKKSSGLTQKERISKNMLDAIELIKEGHKLDKNYILRLHRMIMAGFGSKAPGKFRGKQVYLYRKGAFGSLDRLELSYRPPDYKKIEGMLNEFLDWYNDSTLNPIEKASMAHNNLYKIHPFLDGNKRVCRLIFNKTLLDNGFPLINVSVNKETYFDVIVASVEKNDPRPFVDFVLKQYYKQVREFLAAK